MSTDYNSYIILDSKTFAKCMAMLSVAKTMAEKDFPHLVKDYEWAIKEARERAEMFLGSQNKPKTSKAYTTT